MNKVNNFYFYPHQAAETNDLQENSYIFFAFNLLCVKTKNSLIKSRKREKTTHNFGGGSEERKLKIRENKRDGILWLLLLLLNSYFNEFSKIVLQNFHFSSFLLLRVFT
jgi:hypothetical protein